MTQLSIRLGFWSSFLIALAYVIFTACFAGILLTAPLFIWSDLAAYVAYVEANSQFFQNLARLSMLLVGPLYVVLLNSIYEYADAGKKILARIGLHFGLAFAVLTGINYFVQLTAVRFNLAQGELQGLEQWLQANPISALSAVNLLGWTLFFGLSSLVVAPVFAGGRLETVIKVAFLANGVFCLLAGIAYAFDLVVLLFLTINLGMGGAVLVASVALCILFYRQQTLSKAHPAAT